MRPWGVKRLFRFPFRTREDVRTDIADEFAFHLDMRRDELMRGGLDETEARARAAREFGDRAAGVRACAETGDRFERRRRIGQLAGELRQDVTLGLRLLGRNPGFATVAILTLALGIGANTAIYSVLDALLLRPLPYPEPHRLVQVSETLENGSPNSVSGGAFLDWRTHQTTFEAIALTGRVSYNLRGGGPPERLTGLEVSHEFLRVLGVQPLLGRGFMPEDDRPGGRNDVVLLTEELWRTRFGGDTAIVGRAITLDEVPRTVVGVLPEGAWVLKEDAFFVPAVLAPGTPRAARAPHWAAVFGRLAPDADVARADAELKSVKRRLDSEYPAFKRPWGVVVQPVTDVIGGLTRRPLLILLAAVSMVLLIACANVANLLLARACHRQQELAVRAALGAGNRRLVRQVLTENLVLAVVGGAAGIGVAHLSVDVLRRLTADVLPFTFSPELDLRVLTFSLAVTMATGLLFGLLPALRARRLALTGTLNDGGRSATAGGGHRTQSLLIVAEVALTVVLLTSAGLLLRSLGEAASTDPGFDPSRALAFDLSLPDATYASSARRLAFSTSLLERVRALPGVSAAGTGMAIPFSGGGYGEYFRLPGRTELRDMALGRMNFVSPGYLEALGTRVLAGRRLTEADNRGGGARVAVISEATARQFFRDGDAIGQTLVVASDSWQIVGVIADVVDRRLDAVRGAFGVRAAGVQHEPALGGRSHAARSGEPGPRRASGDCATRPGGGARQPPRARSSHDRLDDPTQGDPGARRRLRCDGTGACEHRPLRRDGLRGGHAPPRARYPHGARRRARRRHARRHRRRPPHDGDGAARRPHGRHRRGAIARERVVSGDERRPARPGRYDGDRGHRCGPGLRDPGVARRTLRSDSRAAQRVKPRIDLMRSDGGVLDAGTGPDPSHGPNLTSSDRFEPRTKSDKFGQVRATDQIRQVRTV